MYSVIHLVYATDEGYLIPSLVSALRAVHHCSKLDDLAIHIVDCGIRKEDSWIGAQGRGRLWRDLMCVLG